MERRNAWLSYTEAEEKELEQVAKAYRNFLNVGKTERECVTQIIREARAAGYESLEEKTAKGEKLKAGDKVYTVGMKKIIALLLVAVMAIGFCACAALLPYCNAKEHSLCFFRIFPDIKSSVCFQCINLFIIITDFLQNINTLLTD